MASSTYAAPKGTEVSTVIDGETVRVVFKDGIYTCSTPALIAVLDDCAEAEGHPIGFAPKET
jgi:hypothetical protein